MHLRLISETNVFNLTDQHSNDLVLDSDFPMTALLDIDQLRTFIAIAETAASRAPPSGAQTQSAVSMQMKRLEERLGKPIFERDGRASKLTTDGERLLDYARRIVKLTWRLHFDRRSRPYRQRALGVPDDYADGICPRSWRASRARIPASSSPSSASRREPSRCIDNGDIDLAIITHSSSTAGDIIRRERLLWVTSTRSAIHLEEVPLALGRQTCAWRRIAIEKLQGRPPAPHPLYKLERRAIGAAVLAVSLCPCSPNRRFATACALIGEQDGFPSLPAIDIGLLRNAHEPPRSPMRLRRISCRASTTYRAVAAEVREKND